MKKHINSALLVTSIALVGSSFSALATTTFEQFDKDGNGSISKTEASADPRLNDQFKKLDSDGNGELSQTEFGKFEG